MIDLLVIGTGAMVPLPTRWLSSVLVRADGELVLFDCGEGTQIPWRSYGWGFRRLSAICFSHWHADHIAGLPGLLHTLANAGRTEPVAIYGPVGIREVVAGLRVIAPDLPYAVDVIELVSGDSASLPGGLRAQVLAGEHRISVLTYRVSLDRARRFDPDRARALGIPVHRWRLLQNGEAVSWDGGSAVPADVLGDERPGISFGFATDTRPVDAFASFFADVDLLITEGTYGNSDDLHKALRNKHMTFAEAASIARDAKAKALWLTHFSSAMDDPSVYLDRATAIFPETTLAYSGLTGSLRFVDPTSG